MSQEEAHGTASATFSPQECSALHDDDKKAAKSIVVLMVGVFLVGLVMYLFIAMTL